MHHGSALVTEQVFLFMLVADKATQLLLYDKVSLFLPVTSLCSKPEMMNHGNCWIFGPFE